MGKMIFEPLQLGSMTLKNRIGLAPLLNIPRGQDFGPNEKTVTWFEHRATGGAGLITTGAVMAIQALLPGGPERFAKIAKAVHKYGAKLAVKSPGKFSGPDLVPGRDFRPGRMTGERRKQA